MGHREGKCMIAREFGRRGQESILLVPGNMMSWRQFEHVIPLLADEHHVIAISTDGYDGSTTFTTAEASAESVEEYLREHLDGSVGLVFGESFGCATAGMLFHRKRVRVGSMILSGPQYMSLGPLNAVLKEIIPRNQDRLLRTIQGQKRLPLLLKLYTRTDDDKLLAQFSAVPEDISLDTLRNAMDEALRLYEAIDGFAPELDARVAIWYGAREPNMRKAVRKLRRAFPNAEEHPFVGYGHGEIIAHPDVMAREIRAFLRGGVPTHEEL